MRLGRGQCIEQYGAGEPYMPVLEAMSRLGQEDGGERVVEVLNRFAPTWVAQKPALLTLRRACTVQGSVRAEAADVRELARRWRRWRRSPLVLSARRPERLGNQATIEGARRGASRRCYSGTYRPRRCWSAKGRTMKQKLELHRYCEELRLKLLSEIGCRGYLANRFSSNDTAAVEGLEPLIHERTDGNPLFMINVVDTWSTRVSWRAQRGQR